MRQRTPACARDVPPRCPHSSLVPGALGPRGRLTCFPLVLPWTPAHLTAQRCLPCSSPAPAAPGPHQPRGWEVRGVHAAAIPSNSRAGGVCVGGEGCGHMTGQLTWQGGHSARVPLGKGRGQHPPGRQVGARRDATRAPLFRRKDDTPPPSPGPAVCPAEAGAQGRLCRSHRAPRAGDAARLRGSNAADGDAHLTPDPAAAPRPRGDPLASDPR